MMEDLNVTTITYGSYETDPVWQWSYGQQIVFDGFGDLLPDTFEVHFANVGAEESEPAIGTVEGVTVPDSVLENGNAVAVWVFLHEGESDGETKYEFVMPIVQRAKPPVIVVPPEQQDIIGQAIAALNSGVTRAQTAAGNAEASETAAAASAAAAAGSASEAYSDAERAETAAGSAEGFAQDAQESEGAAQGYAAAAAASAESADESADRAEQAATTAGYMDVEIDEHGHLIYTRTDAVDVDFDLDQYGHLVMEAIA